MADDAAGGAGRLASGILTNDARRVAEVWLRERMPASLADAVSPGLPEWDARLRLWRVALVSAERPGDAVGELQIAGDGAIRRAPPPVPGYGADARQRPPLQSRQRERQRPPAGAGGYPSAGPLFCRFYQRQRKHKSAFSCRIALLCTIAFSVAYQPVDNSI